MADYAKKKNDELAALCKERGLAHTGKKAELVKRLEDYDAKASEQPAGPEETTAADNIDWDDDAGAASKPPTTKTPAKSTTTDAADKKAAPKTAKPERPSTTTKAGAETVEKGDVSSEQFSLGLQERTLDEEIAKRKKRAEKFGMDISQDETLKLLERAKRFGTNNVPGLLNQALPERTERSKKRGRETRDENEDRKRSRQRGNNEQSQKEQKDTKTDGFPSWMTAKDREAAERRKAKYTSTE